MTFTKPCRRGQAQAGERRRRVTVDVQSDCDLETSQGLQLMDRHRLEVPRHNARVTRTKLEHDAGAGIGGQRLPRRLVQLREMLIGKSQAEPIAACLGEYLVDRLR